MALLLLGQDALIRAASLQLAIVAIFGCILGAISGSAPTLQDQLTFCAERIYSYVLLTEHWRPLGCMSMLLSLQ